MNAAISIKQTPATYQSVVEPGACAMSHKARYWTKSATAEQPPQ